MNTGIELLIKRLKDCPEDFHYDPSTDRSSKWNSLLMEALRSDVITEEEKVTLRAEVTEMGRERFTRKVMQTLAGVEDEPSEDPKSNPYLAPSATRLAGATLASSITPNQFSNTSGAVRIPNGTITLGNTTLNEEQLKHMKAHLDYLNKTKVVVRKKATLR